MIGSGKDYMVRYDSVRLGQVGYGKDYMARFGSGWVRCGMVRCDTVR